jgi:hypothetical protein
MEQENALDRYDPKPRSPRARVLEIHRPVVVNSPVRTVCRECAHWSGTRLRRADWPCPTAVAMGVPETDDGTAYRR